MKLKIKILLVGNLCAHYRIKLFELLDKMFDIKFLFFSEEEKYYDGQKYLGDFNGQYLCGINLMPKVRINPRLIYELLFYDYDILIKCINSPLPLLLSFVISKIRGKKFILWTGIWRHPATLFHKFSFPFVKFIYRHADAIGVYGTHVKKYLHSLGIDEKKIFIFQKAADNSLYNKTVSSEQVRSLRQKLDVANRKVILYVGRLDEVKGIDYLIEAYRELGRNDTTLILIGRGNYQERLEHLAAAHGLNGNVQFLDRIENDKLYTYYAIADVFVLPSITTRTSKETWGMVINEAMNQGCPVIATDAVGAAAGGLVQNGINGFIVPERNSDAIRDALNNILNNEALKNKMRANSKRIVEKCTVGRKAEGFKEAIAFVNKN
jgi:glycosyltransferase involved in cell wall biosynthesis